nr:MAG TPA: hypothetical protein [Caudoviricetes sp.]
MNCGSQGSDLGDGELRKGYLGPIGTHSLILAISL